MAIELPGYPATPLRVFSETSPTHYPGQAWKYFSYSENQLVPVCSILEYRCYPFLCGTSHLDFA